MSTTVDLIASGGPDTRGFITPHTNVAAPAPSYDEDEDLKGDDKNGFAATVRVNDNDGFEDEGREPTQEEKKTLRLVAASLPWSVYVIW